MAIDVAAKRNPATAFTDPPDPQRGVDDMRNAFADTASIAGVVDIRSCGPEHG